MKFQDSSFNGLKVTVGTKSVTHAPKAICPINFFKVGGIIKFPWIISLVWLLKRVWLPLLRDIDNSYKTMRRVL